MTATAGGTPLPDQIDAVFLDAGGVLVTPDPDRVRSVLADVAPEAGTPDDDRLVQAHYRAMAAVDAARSEPEVFDVYVPTYLATLGVSHGEAVDAMHELFSIPYLLWTCPLPGVTEALAQLAATERPVVIVSNADGRVAEALAGIVQVGPGSGTSVARIVDSGVVGIAKPDPAIFRMALDAVGSSPERVVHVGDAHSYDVGGARSAGIHPVLIDPYGLHPNATCTRVASLQDFADLLSSGSGGERSAH